MSLDRNRTTRELETLRRSSRLTEEQPVVDAEDILDLPRPTGETQLTIRNSRMVVKIPFFVPDPNNYIFMTFFINSSANPETIENFLTEKETRDKQISIELRAKGIIITPGEPFVISRRKEINKLLIKGIFELISNNSKEIDN